MYVKTYKTGKNFMVAACDRELIGQRLKNEKCEVLVSASFYQGTEADEEVLAELLMNATTANLIGEKAVACAVKCGIIDPKSVIYFGEIPHALFFLI